MYILLNRERMVVLHKHFDFQVVADLAWIECKGADYSIFPLDDANVFRDYTDLEIKLLYRNITGVDHTLSRLPAIQVVFDAIERIQETNVSRLELGLQAGYLDGVTDGKWLYVRGAKVPAQKADLFEPACCRAKHSEEEVASAKAGKLPALKARPRAVVSPTAAVRPTPNATPATPRPKRGTAKPIIWAVADRLWEEAGKPTDKATVLTLRKQIMTVLETEEAIKRSSSSTELGQWHKERAPF